MSAPDNRRRLPAERRGITHHFSVGGHEGYVNVGLYEDGTVGELFVTMDKEGSVVSGLMDAFATAVSMTLQYGIPLEALVEKFQFARFEPSGYTSNPNIPTATSIVDYLARWLRLRFLTEPQLGPAAPAVNTASGASTTPLVALTVAQSDAPSCIDCGALMVRSGSCYKCANCGSTSGCS